MVEELDSRELPVQGTGETTLTRRSVDAVFPKLAPAGALDNCY